jgi:electron transfer flavoprotein alpha subunit
MASSDIWIFSENHGLLAELIGGARQLVEGTGGAVAAVVAGPRGETQTAIARGADRAIWLGEVPPEGMVEDFVPSLAALLAEARPALVLIGSTRRGRAVAGRLAARLGVSALTDVLQFQRQAGTLTARHMIFGGGAARVERPLSEIALATVSSGTFAALPADAGRAGGVVEAPFVEPPWRVKVRERRALPKASVNLGAARKVVAAGRGVVKQAGLALVEALAAAIGAELACTRPLAEGLGWLPRERYIGISGAVIKPDLYLGVGVSGQAQHLIGIHGTRVVVAINKDSGAPIFAHADYGIAADLYAVLPALTKALQERKT